jgi:ribosome biogenesis protein YTM1
MDTINQEINTPDESNPIESLQDESQVEIKLTSRLEEKYQMPADKIIVPGSVSRLDLSELVNQSLSLDQRVPFDFLINGEFLRGTLFDHCSERGIMSEKTVDIEYVIAMEEPKSTDKTEPQNNWISGIAATENSFFTASLNGIVSKYDFESGKLVESTVDGSLPLSGIATSSNGVILVTSRDGSIKFMDVDTLEILEHGSLASAIQCLSICPFDNSLALTGTSTGEIHLWNVPLSLKVSSEGSSKKRTAITEVFPRAEIDSVAISGISAIWWISLSQIIVSSLDGSIQVIDPISNTRLPVITTNRSITAMTMLSESRLVTGHADGRVIFWTFRCDDTCATLEATNSCRSHSRSITDLKPQPGNDNLVASSSIDGTVKLLDSRAANFAVQSISLPDSTRALCLNWFNNVTLLSGASDGIVRSHVIGEH